MENNDFKVSPEVAFPSDEEFVIATAAQIQQAFTLWDTRYRANPEEFTNEAFRLLFETAETYGEGATPYFLSLLEEVAQQ